MALFSCKIILIAFTIEAFMLDVIGGISMHHCHRIMEIVKHTQDLEKGY